MSEIKELLRQFVPNVLPEGLGEVETWQAEQIRSAIYAIRNERDEARACLRMAMYGELEPDYQEEPTAWVDNDLWKRWRLAAGLTTTGEVEPDDEEEIVPADYVPQCSYPGCNNTAEVGYSWCADKTHQVDYAADDRAYDERKGA